jgi:hypothetical protein
MSAPVEAVLLAIDPAKHTSGAALLIPDYGNTMAGEEEHPFEGNYALAEFGKVLSQGERERFLESALESAIELELPLVVVAEEWDPPRTRKLRLPGDQSGFLMDPKWTYQTVLGIGEGWGRWMAEVESASVFLDEEYGFPAVPVVRVTPNDWRDALFGPRRPKEGSALKETACRYFDGVFGFAASHDISEAGCIGLWGTTAPEVRQAIETWERGKPPPKKQPTKNQAKAARRKRAS